MKKSTKIIEEIIVVLGVVAVLFIIGNVLSQFITFGDVESMTVALKSYGPVIIIPIIILEVVIAPIPGGVLPVVLGAVYGPILGMIYAWIGNVIGSLLAFWIARTLGDRVVRKLIHSSHRERFDSFIHKNSFLIWLMYIIPVFPIDLMSFAIGFSKKRFSWFAILVVVAFIPHLILLTYLGELFVESNLYIRVLIGSIVFLILLIGWRVERAFSAKNNS